MAMDAMPHEMIDDTKIVSVKSTLCTPYSMEWPLLDKGETPEILNAIQRTFEPLKGKLGKVKSRGRKISRAIKTMEDSLAGVDQKTKQDRHVLRSQISIGVNEVTRALEKGLLRSVVVCRSTKPSHMTNHLFSLSATRETPALCLFKLSEVLAPLLNLNTVMAVGFKKTNAESSVFDELVDLIVKKTPRLNLPWLQESKVNLDNLARDHPRVQTNRLAGQEIAPKSVDMEVPKSKSGIKEHLTDLPPPQETSPMECVYDQESRHKLKDNRGKALGVKRPIESICSETPNKQIKLSVPTTTAEYIDVRIDKVKVIPKELKSKRRKKKKGKKAKAN